MSIARFIDDISAQEYYKIVRAILDPVFIPLGFVRQKNIYHRLVNNTIYQFFYCPKRLDTYDFIMCISPICANFDVCRDERGRISLYHLLSAEERAEFWAHTEAIYTLDTSLKDNMKIILQKIIPIFNEVNNYLSYIEYCIDKNMFHYMPPIFLLGLLGTSNQLQKCIDYDEEMLRFAEMYAYKDFDSASNEIANLKSRRDKFREVLLSQTDMIVKREWEQALKENAERNLELLKQRKIKNIIA